MILFLSLLVSAIFGDILMTNSGNDVVTVMGRCHCQSLRDLTQSHSTNQEKYVLIELNYYYIVAKDIFLDELLCNIMYY